jgi:predicted esterase
MDAPALSPVEDRFEVPRPVRALRLGDVGAATRACWIALHGYGETAATMARRSRWPASSARVWCFPEAPHRFYVTEGQGGRTHAELPVGASWMTRDLREADIGANHAYLDTVVTRIGLSPLAGLRVIGFSQGSATAARWVAARAAVGDPPQALVVWGALLPPDLPIGPGSAIAAVPLTLVCGTRDRWVSEDRFAAEVDRLQRAQQPVRVLRFDGGHRVDDQVLRALTAEDGA